MNAYIFRVEIDQEEPGVWTATVPSLPGCSVWEGSRDAALEAIEEATRIYVEELVEEGQPVPTDVGVDIHNDPFVVFIA